MTRALAIAAAALIAAAGYPAQAGEVEAFHALRLLGQMSGMRPPPDSGCEGELPGIRRPTLGELVASRLAVFEGGENRISGQCDAAGRCQVDMGHADGEDVSSAGFTFRTSGGRAVLKSLRCTFTP